jgi:four helix bundle protein
VATAVNPRGHRGLVAWEKAMELLTETYRITRNFPKDELYGLGSQLRRAAVSVPSNLAEGYGRNSRNEFHQFIGVARGSLAEVETQIEIAKNLHYVNEKSFSELLSRKDEVGRALTGLRTWSEKRGKQ